MGHARRVTAFSDSVSNSIDSSVRTLAQRINRHHITNNFTVKEIQSLTVRPHDVELADASWPRFNHHIVDSEGNPKSHLWASCGLLRTKLQLPEEVTNHSNSEHGTIVSFCMDRNSQHNWMPLDYQYVGKTMLDTAEPELQQRLINMVSAVLVTGVEYAMLGSLVSYLNRSYTKDPEHVRYLFPGIVPLLKMVGNEECDRLATKLFAPRTSYRHPPLDEDRQEALRYCNELVAMGLLYDNKPTPHALSVNYGELYVGGTGSKWKHKLWPTYLSPHTFY